MSLWFFMYLTIWTNSIRSTSIFVSISPLGFRFFLKLSVDYPFSSKEKFSRSLKLPICCWLKLCTTHLLLVSYFTMFIIICMYIEEMVASMEEVLVALKHMQQKNQALREFVAHLQSVQASTSLGCVPMTPSEVKEPWISLLDRFDGTCSKFWSFINQMWLVIRLHPHHYPNGPT